MPLNRLDDHDHYAPAIALYASECVSQNKKSAGLLTIDGSSSIVKSEVLHNMKMALVSGCNAFQAQPSTLFSDENSVGAIKNAKSPSEATRSVTPAFVIKASNICDLPKAMPITATGKFTNKSGNIRSLLKKRKTGTELPNPSSLKMQRSAGFMSDPAPNLLNKAVRTARSNSIDCYSSSSSTLPDTPEYLSDDSDAQSQFSELFWTTGDCSDDSTPNSENDLDLSTKLSYNQFDDCFGLPLSNQVIMNFQSPPSYPMCSPLHYMASPSLLGVPQLSRNAGFDCFAL